MSNQLKWKTKHSNNFQDEYDFLETILLDNGVEEKDIKAFLHPTKDVIHNPFDMKNMEEAVELVHNHVEKGSKIFVKVDADVDGYCSAATFIQFLQEINPQITIDYCLNYEKKHGLTYEDISNHTRDEYGLIVIPDASMKVKDAIQITKNFDADILVLDHHLVEEEDGNCYTNYCLAVNCTDGTYPNPSLSGAGVVQKFIEAYVETYEGDRIDFSLTEKYLDLVSLAINADAMDLRSLESRYYVIEGMKEPYWNNEFLNELVDRNAEEMKYGRYIISMAWNIAPKINGMIRYGKPEEQLDTFRAMLGVQEDREYQPRRRSKNDPVPPKEIHSLQKTMARVCENVKSRQDNEVRKFVNELDAEIQSQELDKNSVIFIDGTKILTTSTVTGLVANKLATKYFRPVVLMRKSSSTEYGGSGRNYSRSNIDSLNAFLTDVGVHCMGHEDAFGVSFKQSDLSEIIKKCNKKMPLSELTTVYEADWEIPASKLKNVYVQEVANNYEVFGSTVPQPLFAITGIHINASQIQAFGENNNYIRFNYNGINFSKKYCKKNEYDELTLRTRNILGVNKKELDIDIVGEFVLNYYNDETYAEVKIIDFASKEVPKTNTKEENFEETIVRKPRIKEDLDEDFDW